MPLTFYSMITEKNELTNLQILSSNYEDAVKKFYGSLEELDYTMFDSFEESDEY